MLEIGTGSYQAAVLAEMGIEVYTVEVIAELAATAAPRLERLGYQQVHMLEADGYFGWDEHAPYDPSSSPPLPTTSPSRSWASSSRAGGW